MNTNPSYRYLEYIRIRATGDAKDSTLLASASTNETSNAYWRGYAAAMHTISRIATTAQQRTQQEQNDAGGE